MDGQGFGFLSGNINTAKMKQRLNWMKKIENIDTTIKPELTAEIKKFWERNINAERIYGRTISDSKRGEDKYFTDLEEQRYRTHYHLLPWIRDMKPGKRVLEIGCGIGLDSFKIASHGMDLYAIDLTQVGIKTVKERFLRKEVPAHFNVGDACNLPFPNAVFDYVYSFGVLHHVADTKKSVSEVFRVLKPSGEARIMLYHRRSLNETIHHLTRVPFEEKDELCPVVRRYTKTEVRKLFADFSKVDIDVQYVFGEGYGAIYRAMPKWLYRMLSKTVGWHLMIRATKD
ncbi:class I SAM-dependent methyltransferase [Ectothiorhodospiraceae bacterium BW-2]|nr:class I SAM-dependent methyltransferase [Ectothiorhodospiraceae bacterium BW-2]